MYVVFQRSQALPESYRAVISTITAWLAGYTAIVQLIDHVTRRASGKRTTEEFSYMGGYLAILLPSSYKEEEKK